MIGDLILFLGCYTIMVYGLYFINEYTKLTDRLNEYILMQMENTFVTMSEYYINCEKKELSANV